MESKVPTLDLIESIFNRFNSDKDFTTDEKIKILYQNIINNPKLFNNSEREFVLVLMLDKYADEQLNNRRIVQEIRIINELKKMPLSSDDYHKYDNYLKNDIEVPFSKFMNWLFLFMSFYYFLVIITYYFFDDIYDKVFANSKVLDTIIVTTLVLYFLKLIKPIYIKVLSLYTFLFFR